MGLADAVGAGPFLLAGLEVSDTALTIVSATGQQLRVAREAKAASDGIVTGQGVPKRCGIRIPELDFPVHSDPGQKWAIAGESELAVAGFVARDGFDWISGFRVPVADQVRVANEGVFGKIPGRVACKTRIGAEVELRHDCFVTRCLNDVVDVLSYAVGGVAGYDALERVCCGARLDETCAIVLAFEVVGAIVVGSPFL